MGGCPTITTAWFVAACLRVTTILQIAGATRVQPKHKILRGMADCTENCSLYYPRGGQGDAVGVQLSWSDGTESAGLQTHHLHSVLEHHRSVSYKTGSKSAPMCGWGKPCGVEKTLGITTATINITTANASSVNFTVASMPTTTELASTSKPGFTLSIDDLIRRVKNSILNLSLAETVAKRNLALLLHGKAIRTRGPGTTAKPSSGNAVSPSSPPKASTTLVHPPPGKTTSPLSPSEFSATPPHTDEDRVQLRIQKPLYRPTTTGSSSVSSKPPPGPSTTSAHPPAPATTTSARHGEPPSSPRKASTTPAHPPTPTKPRQMTPTGSGSGSGDGESPSSPRKASTTPAHPPTPAKPRQMTPTGSGSGSGDGESPSSPLKASTTSASPTKNPQPQPTTGPVNGPQLTSEMPRPTTTGAATPRPTTTESSSNATSPSNRTTTENPRPQPTTTGSSNAKSDSSRHASTVPTHHQPTGGCSGSRDAETPPCPLKAPVPPVTGISCLHARSRPRRRTVRSIILALVMHDTAPKPPPRPSIGCLPKALIPPSPGDYGAAQAQPSADGPAHSGGVASPPSLKAPIPPSRVTEHSSQHPPAPVPGSKPPVTVNSTQSQQVAPARHSTQAEPAAPRPGSKPSADGHSTQPPPAPGSGSEAPVSVNSAQSQQAPGSGNGPPVDGHPTQVPPTPSSGSELPVSGHSTLPGPACCGPSDEGSVASGSDDKLVQDSNVTPGSDTTTRTTTQDRQKWLQHLADVYATPNY